MRHLQFLSTEDILPTLDVAFGAYEKAALRSLVLSFLAANLRSGRFRASEEFLEWYLRYSEEIGLRIRPLQIAAKQMGQGKLASSVSIRLVRDSVDKQLGSSPAPSSLQRRLEWVFSTLKLDQSERKAIAALCRLTQLIPCRALVAALSNTSDERDEVSAHLVGEMIGVRGSGLRKLFGTDSRLNQLGLIEERGGNDYALSGMLLNILRERSTDPATLENALLGAPIESSLELIDFEHVGPEGRNVIGIIEGALTQRAEGVGILLYGSPGTGKTEFAKLLGKACGARVVFAGETCTDRQEPRRSDRLAHLALISAIGSRAGRVIVVMDEADDVFLGVDDDEVQNRSGSKVFINRLVETCAVPTVWITNHPDRLGASVVRRMLTAVEFRKPSFSVRRRIVERQCFAQGFNMEAASIDQLAQLQNSPAVISSAIRSAKLASAGPGMAIDTALSLQKVLDESTAPLQAIAATRFDAALSSADVDLAELERDVRAAKTAALSFLFTGQPGTGKSAYARHLADCLGMEVLVKRGSDLLGKYVGETEKNIARAFQEATANGMFLLFDEADSFLFDRRTARNSWEVGQVNELLMWMEAHRLPFAATSNLVERFDPAVHRRFLFKVRFGPMTPQQICTAYNRYFNAEAPLDVQHLQNLTPGDFAVVARKSQVLSLDTKGIAGQLKAEVASKPNAARPIGFVV